MIVGGGVFPIVVTSNSGSPIVGQRIYMGHSPHRFIHFVVSIDSPTSFTLREIVRPSKGYRRHVRKEKQRARQ